MQLIRGAICKLHGRRLKREKTKNALDNAVGTPGRNRLKHLKPPEGYSTNLWLQMSR